ncbi:MFS transporter [Paraburkholderia caribensis]|uniref:MFS transporter n=1 Tax=Paraburkholderia caribensis TaxID=75105 RepID=UPI0007C6C037|nr:MFS transporter [Paraburkholderia caribensis]
MTQRLGTFERENADTLRKITWRLVPFLMLCYFISYIDRINIGFAALEMRGDLHLSQTAYGLGGSLFLVSYCLFSVPSNLGQRRFGTRRWIGFLMILWGALSMATAGVKGPSTFYLLRFLVGAAEAGFFPGVVFYITCWFPASYRARIASIFLLAVPLSSFFGSAISASLMELNGYGLSGWQWMFLIEGAPSILLGLCFLWLMADGPRDVSWLADEQKQALSDALLAEEQAKPQSEPRSMLSLMLDRRILALSLTYSGVLSVGVCLSLWQPQLIKSFGLTNLQTGLVSSVPFGVATVVMVFWGRSSDRSNERVWHTVIALMLSAVAMLATFMIHSLAATVVLLSLMLVGSYSSKGPFWALVTQWLPARDVSAGLSIVSGVGSMATALTTWLFGVVREQTGSFELALLPLVVLAVSGSVALFSAKPTRDDATYTEIARAGGTET